VKHFTAADVPDQAGKCVMVTGANTGLGFEAARVLAARGARVLLACRSEEKARGAMARIAAETPAADLAFLPLDQADLDSVRRTADLAAREPRIDVLINNAGVMIPPLTRTAQGFELQFGVNHLGTFALTGLLLAKLSETPGSRVVVTASLAHRNGNIDFSDLQAEKSYSRMKRYADSKLANMLFFTELDRRLRAAGLPVSAIGCHPGVAATDLGRHMGAMNVLRPLTALLVNSAEQGAYPTLQAACDPAAAGGDYFGPQGFFEARGASGKASRTRRSQREDLAQRLWQVSVELTGVDLGI
jgi:NAD(P)-dependent dehydrogenase (short-subunit alcohol dehydrogenase family)